MRVRADELIDAFVRLADAIGEPAGAATVVRELAARCGWGERPISAPLLPSGISHGVPWGVSLAIGSPELRVFVEPQDPSGTLAAYGARSRAVLEWLAQSGAVVDELRAMIAELPTHRLWFSVVFTRDAAPRWHAYLCNPPARLVPTLPLRPVDRVTMLSMDLVSAERRRRRKAYVLMPDATPSTLAALHDRARGAQRGDAERFAHAMLGDARAIWWLAAVGLDADDALASCALHLGVPRHLDESLARARIRAWLDSHGLDATTWMRAAAVLGRHHFVTFQRRDGVPRVTTYFLPEVAR